MSLCTRMTLKALALGAAVAAFSSGAMAATLQLTLNAYSNGNGLGGGSYTASNSGLNTSAYSPTSLVGAPGTFETFCLEYGEYFSSGGTYNYTIDSAAKLGSGGAVAGSDPLSMATAWLYAQFANGTLAGYNYGAGRAASNNDLQLAIWFFEQETPLISGYSTYGTSSGNTFINAAVSFFGSEAAAKADANGAYNVSVLNLTDNNGTPKQSQLYVQAVPDLGSSFLLLGIGLASMVGAQRRFRRRA